MAKKTDSRRRSFTRRGGSGRKGSLLEGGVGEKKRAKSGEGWSQLVKEVRGMQGWAV